MLRNLLKNISWRVSWLGVLLLGSLNQAHGAGPQSPLSIKSFGALLAAIVDIFVQIGYPIVVVMIIYAGFLFVTAQGNPGKLKAAKDAIWWTLLGAAIVLGAKVISSAVQATIVQVTG